mmetsp:Transcript_59520/g.126538  ORF Transcript_59520/g.126538 Transcript_59520/m.126538 type:complete len:209 (+) Transcript_59520:45-671(+)
MRRRNGVAPIAQLRCRKIGGTMSDGGRVVNSEPGARSPGRRPPDGREWRSTSRREKRTHREDSRRRGSVERAHTQGAAGGGKPRRLRTAGEDDLCGRVPSSGRRRRVGESRGSSPRQSRRRGLVPVAAMPDDEREGVASHRALDRSTTGAVGGDARSKRRSPPVLCELWAVALGTVDKDGETSPAQPRRNVWRRRNPLMDGSGKAAFF